MRLPRGTSLVIAALAVVGIVGGGTAVADTAGDSGANRNQSRRQAGKPAEAGPSSRQGADRRSESPSAPARTSAGELAGLGAARVPTSIRQDAEDIAARFDAAAAAALPEDLSNVVDYAMSPAAQQAALGPGGNVPTVGMGGLVPNARALAAYVSSTYPGVQAIGGVRSDPLPDHPSGHAIDIMIGGDMGLGDAINADVQSQAGRFGVSYTLWRVANHYDHVHVTVF